MKSLKATFHAGLLAMCLCLLGALPAKAAVTPVPIAMDTKVMSDLNDSVDCRYYSFTLPAAGYLSVDWTVFAHGFTMKLKDERMADVAGGWDLRSNGGSPNDPRFVDAAGWYEPGSYYLQVCKTWPTSGNGDFWMTLSFEPAGNQETEPNQTYAAANALTMNKTVRGLLSTQDGDDYYKVTLTGQQKLELCLTAYIHGIKVDVLDSGMRNLSGDTVWGGGSLENPIAYSKEFDLAAGTYYIHLFRNATGPSSYGLYDLTVKPPVVPVADVELNYAELSLYRGKSKKVTAVALPSDATNKNINWTSANSAVASVDGYGNVKAVSAGTTVITAMAADGSGASASCTVTVKNPTLKVNAGKFTIYKGKTATITAKTTPSAKITFTPASAAKKYLSVSSKGKITAKKAGTGKIYVKANGLKKTITVTVKNPTLTLKKTKATIRVGKTYTIRATAAPKAKITYKSSNTKLASVDSKGKIRAKKKGNCKIYVQANGVKKTFSVKIVK